MLLDSSFRHVYCGVRGFVMPLIPQIKQGPIRISTGLFERWVGPYLPTNDQINDGSDFCRLGFVEEGGGKRRIFAIGNDIKQRL